MDALERPHTERATDHGTLCRLARVASFGWDWLERRMILERAVAVAILYGTIKVTTWAMGYAETHDEVHGSDAALIIAAVLAPYMTLQGYAAKLMFDRLK